MKRARKCDNMQDSHVGGSKPILNFTGACPPLSLFFTFFLLSPLLEARKRLKARDDGILGNSDDEGAKAMQVRLSYLLFHYCLLPSPAQMVMQMQEDAGRHAHGQMGGLSPPICKDVARTGGAGTSFALFSYSPHFLRHEDAT